MPHFPHLSAFCKTLPKLVQTAQCICAQLYHAEVVNCKMLDMMVQSIRLHACGCVSFSGALDLKMDVILCDVAI